MFKSFNEEKFFAAIEQKNYLSIKNCIINAIRNNPQFKVDKGETEAEAIRAINIVRKKLPEMFEEYVIREREKGKELNNPNFWDEEYFLRQTFLLEENFCEERIAYIKKIGQKISEDKKQKERVKSQHQSSFQEKSKQNAVHCGQGVFLNPTKKETQGKQEEKFRKKPKKSFLQKKLDSVKSCIEKKMEEKAIGKKRGKQ